MRRSSASCKVWQTKCEQIIKCNMVPTRNFPESEGGAVIFRLNPRAIIAMAACIVAGCSPAEAPDDGGQTSMLKPESYAASASQTAAGQGAPPVPEASGTCIEQEVTESQSVKGLTKMASAGSYELFATGGDLACSEPSANGVGECELAVDQMALIIGGSTQRRLKAVGGTAVVFYGPNGVSCMKGKVH